MVSQLTYDIVPFDAAVTSHGKRFYQLYSDFLIERIGRLEPIDERVLSNPVAEIIQHDGEVWLAIECGNPAEVIGSVALINSPLGMEISKLIVASEARGRGIAKALLNHVFARGRARGLDRLFLLTTNTLTEAAALYAHMGMVRSDIGRAERALYERATCRWNIRLD